MASQTMLAGMKFFINGVPNSQEKESKFLSQSQKPCIKDNGMK